MTEDEMNSTGEWWWVPHPTEVSASRFADIPSVHLASARPQPYPTLTVVVPRWLW